MIQIFETSKDTDKRFAEIPEEQRINKNFHGYSGTVYINKDKKYQSFKGFGGAITESTGYVLSKLPENVKASILKSYFDDKSGIGYTFTRTHMNSCDFSLENWACVETKDETLQSFSMERTDKYLTPYIREANSITGDKLNVLITPWSPPAWMKTNNDMNHGGKLLPQYKQLWADYYARFLTELKNEGIDVKYISVQNEPAAVQVWDSCEYSAREEGEFVVDYLYPTLKKAGFDIKILVWDHNRDALKDRFDESMAVSGADEAIGGAAFHWYSGDQFDQVKYIAEKYPDKELFFTEGCVEGGPRPGAWFTGERYAHNIINDLNSGCNAWIDWNLVLNMKGGPNHVNNFCDAPILADEKTGETHYQSSYYYIGHFSRYIKPGARRLSVIHDNGWIPASISGRGENFLESVAFENPDGTIVFVITNRTEADLTFHFRMSDWKEPKIYTISPRSIQTYIFD